MYVLIHAFTVYCIYSFHLCSQFLGLIIKIIIKLAYKFTVNCNYFYLFFTYVHNCLFGLKLNWPTLYMFFLNILYSKVPYKWSHLKFGGCAMPWLYLFILFFSFLFYFHKRANLTPTGPTPRCACRSKSCPCWAVSEFILHLWFNRVHLFFLLPLFFNQKFNSTVWDWCCGTCVWRCHRCPCSAVLCFIYFLCRAVVWVHATLHFLSS